MSEDATLTADEPSELPRGRVTLEPPQPKKTRHVRSPAQQQALQKAREKAHSMLRGSKWVVESETAPPPPVAVAPVREPDHIDRRMTELVAMTRLQLENERLARKLSKYRERSAQVTPPQQPQATRAYDTLIMGEIKRLAGK